MDNVEKFVSNNRNRGDGSGDGYGYGNGNGYGYGIGSGRGNGNGNGSGYGYGIGSGYGYGNGYGNGSGNGNGYGNGYGNGRENGNGSGYGYGSGDGYGNGYGIESINGMKVYNIDIPTIITSVFKNIARGYILEHNVYLKPCYVVKGNGYFAHGETIKSAMEELEAKIFENIDVEEKIDMFLKKFKTGVKYPVKNFYEWHNKLTGSCEMGRKNFATNHNIDIENDTMTVDEFIDITQNSYGTEIILQLKETLKSKK